MLSEHAEYISPGGDSIKTYFTSKVTEELLKLYNTNTQDCDCDVIIPFVLKFLYGDEDTSEGGDTDLDV